MKKERGHRQRTGQTGFSSGLENDGQVGSIILLILSSIDILIFKIFACECFICIRHGIGIYIMQ